MQPSSTARNRTRLNERIIDGRRSAWPASWWTLYKIQQSLCWPIGLRWANEAVKSAQVYWPVVTPQVRGTLKSWTKLWCVLKPGLLLIYKSQKTKSSHWVGTVMLTSCQVIERPSKKDGFCFKLFHPLEQSIWAPRGPDKETIGKTTYPSFHALLTHGYRLVLL